MVERIVSTVLFLIWVVLVFLVGKGGLAHLLLIAAICTASIDVVAVYRSRMTVTDAIDRDPS
jgi:hypothetical protein